MKFIRSKNALFLIELIITIFFFSISSALCIQIFVKMHDLSQRTISLNHFMIKMENCAEIFTSTKGNLELVSNYLGVQETSSFILYYDKNNSICDSTKAIYSFHCSINLESNNIKTLILKLIKVYDNEELLIIEQAIYVPPNIED